MWNPYRSLTQTQQNLMTALSFALLLSTWSVLSLWIGNPARLPTPWSTAEAFMRLCWDGHQSLMLSSVLGSLTRIVVAGVLVFLIGTPIGILMGASSRINALLSPIADPLRSAPVAAILPVLVMWMGIDEGMKVTFLFLGAVVYLIPMVRDAVKAVPQTYWISTYDLGATPFEAILKAVVPMAMPRIADALVAAVSIEWTYITVAEYVNAERGLGKIISDAKRIGAMNSIFATILVIIVLALLTYRLMNAAKRRLYPWEAE